MEHIAPGELLERGLRYLRPYGVDVYLFDRSDPRDRVLLHYHRSRMHRPQGDDRDQHGRNSPSLRYSSLLSVAGSEWEVVCTTVPGAVDAARTWESWGVLAGGLLVTLLVATSARLLTTRARSVQALVESQTRDLTKANEDLAVARDKALESSRLKSQFLANMSHEIRTPMNGIMGMTELALDTDLSPDQREFMSTVLSSSHSLLSIINNILDFSKMEADKLQLDPYDFQLRPLMEELGAMFAVEARKKGIELRLDIGVESGSPVHGDKGRLRQILVNLIGNALKFTKRGEIVVRVEEVARCMSGVELHFAVSDTGIGIPLDRQKSIFEAFTQVDGSTTRLYGGTGLGLTISSSLVALMGGRIWLKSEPGQGATFHLTLPFKTALAIAAPVAPQQAWEFARSSVGPAIAPPARDSG